MGWFSEKKQNAELQSKESLFDRVRRKSYFRQQEKTNYERLLHSRERISEVILYYAEKEGANDLVYDGCPPDETILYFVNQGFRVTPDRENKTCKFEW